MLKLPTYSRWLIHEHNLASYYNSLLLSGEAPQVATLIKKDPANFTQLIALLTTKGLPLSSRMGIGVVMEELAGSEVLQNQIELLMPLTEHPDARLRADACYYLELSGNPLALPSVIACLQDSDPSVRELAQDAVSFLKRQQH